MIEYARIVAILTLIAPGDPGHIQHKISLSRMKVLFLYFCEFVSKIVFYNISKTKISYLNRLFRYSKKRVGVWDPRAKITLFLI